MKSWFLCNVHVIETPDSILILQHVLKVTQIYKPQNFIEMHRQTQRSHVNTSEIWIKSVSDLVVGYHPVMAINMLQLYNTVIRVHYSYVTIIRRSFVKGTSEFYALLLLQLLLNLFYYSFLVFKALHCTICIINNNLLFRTKTQILAFDVTLPLKKICNP